MNARKFLNVRVSLTVTALALSGAFAFSAMTTSCAGSGGGGSTGSGNGGSSGGGSSGNGGSSGGGSSGASCSPGADSVCFASGQASGVLTGYGWIALGQFNTATSPVCDNSANGGGTSEAITKANPCPSSGGKTVWSSSTGLCITGSVPKVGTTPGVTGPDYTGYWGLELGANASSTEGNSVDLSKYTKVSFAFDPSAVSPTPTGLIRGVISVKGHVPADEGYCANVTPGTAASLTAFNTKCWDGTGTNLTTDDLKNILNMGLEITSNATSDYTATNFCWTGISFQ